MGMKPHLPDTPAGEDTWLMKVRPFMGWKWLPHRWFLLKHLLLQLWAIKRGLRRWGLPQRTMAALGGWLLVSLEQLLHIVDFVL